MPLVEHELLTRPEHLSSPPVFSGVCVTRSLVLCIMFVDVVCLFVLFLLAIVLSVLRFMDSDYPFGISKLFLDKYEPRLALCNSNGNCSFVLHKCDIVHSVWNSILIAML